MLSSVGLNSVRWVRVRHPADIGGARAVDAVVATDWTNGLLGVDSVPSRTFDLLERHMTSAKTNGLVIDIAGLRERAGTHIGYTDWQEMTQERVNQFADATDDHQFIHVD
ncbi:MAG TPA: hypothetical protein VMJ65_30325, partial [Solirubrobacteraceae bacterium]|nr:hypothetical protein [Solirubrobacteraceae bacterium]